MPEMRIFRTAFAAFLSLLLANKDLFYTVSLLVLAFEVGTNDEFGYNADGDELYASQQQRNTKNEEGPPSYLLSQ